MKTGKAFKFINNISIGVKLVSSFGTVLLLLALIIAVYHHANVSSINGFKNLLETERAIDEHAGAITVSMLQCRRSEKDFLLSKDKKHMGLLHDNVSVLKRETVLIQALAEKANYPDMVKKAERINSLADHYAKSFEAVARDYEEQGLDHNSGLRKEFRKAAHGLADTIKGAKDRGSYIQLLELRKHEKDYLLRGEKIRGQGDLGTRWP